MKKLTFLFLLLTIVFLDYGCKESSTEPSDTDTSLVHVNCDSLKIGIVNIDSKVVKAEIDKLTKDLLPKIKPNDQFGHRENMSILINRLNSFCSIEAELFCYACVKTNPPQSEIFVNTDSNGTQIRRVIDLWTSAESNLRFVRIHD